MSASVLTPRLGRPVPTLFTGLVTAVFLLFGSVQSSSVAQLCPTLCDPMDCSTPGFPLHHQLLELTQTHVHWVGDAIQPSHPLLSPSPPTFNLSQHQGLITAVFLLFGNLPIMGPSRTKAHLDPIFQSPGSSWISCKRLELSIPDSFWILPSASNRKMAAFWLDYNQVRCRLLFLLGWTHFQLPQLGLCPGCLPQPLRRGNSLSCLFQSILPHSSYLGHLRWCLKIWSQEFKRLTSSWWVLTEARKIILISLC